MSNVTELSGGSATATLAAAGKYLAFKVASERYGVPIKRVQEIIRKLPVTRIPHAPEYIRGVFNLRGRVIPMADMRGRMRFAAADDTDRTCIVVARVDINGVQTDLGMVVDDVPQVVDIGTDDIEPAPPLGTHVDTHCLQGMGKCHEEVVLLLDLERTFASLGNVLSGSDSKPGVATADTETQDGVES